MDTQPSLQDAHRSPFREPKWVDTLASDLRLAWVWLVARVWLGYQWWEAGYHKVRSPAWMNGGSALRGYWEKAVSVPAPPAKPAISFAWYREFLQFLLNIHAYTWFAKLVTLGELAVGAALIVGAFTGVAAFFGGLMNWNYLMAGTASTNPVLFALALLMIFAWKTAGWIGLDRWLLPLVGTPWQPGRIFHLRDHANEDAQGE